MPCCLDHTDAAVAPKQQWLLLMVNCLHSVDAFRVARDYAMIHSLQQWYREEQKGRGEAANSCFRVAVTQ